MKINGISYWMKDGKCAMLNLDEGLRILRIPAFMDKVNGEVIGLCGSVEKFIVEDGNPNYYVKNNCLMSVDGELVAGVENGVIPTDGSVKRIGNMAFLHKAPTHLVIPDGVQAIGYRAFAESKNLRSVYIPESVQEIASAFERCENLKNIFFGGSREQWNALVQNQEEKLFCREPHYVYCKNIEGRHLCPICGKTMFPECDSYEICEVCGWEDDLDYERFPDEDEESGANGCTIAEYKKWYLEHVKADPDYNWRDDIRRR